MVGPSIRTERSLIRAGALRVCGMDEVGRGALAGPVAVGVVVVDRATRSAPQGLRDSKLLRPAVRSAIAPKLRRWCVESAVGYSGSSEIDELGLTAALRLAGLRALAQVGFVDHVVLDGNYDWLSPVHGEAREIHGESGKILHRSGLVVESDSESTSSETSLPPAPVQVTTIIGGDRLCSSVAAASVVAKVDRDTHMIGLSQAFPEYGWDLNKGYSTPQHMNAIRAYGPSGQHRLSWNLPARTGVGSA